MLSVSCTCHPMLQCKLCQRVSFLSANKVILQQARSAQQELAARGMQLKCELAPPTATGWDATVCSFVLGLQVDLDVGIRFEPQRLRGYF